MEWVPKNERLMHISVRTELTVHTGAQQDRKAFHRLLSMTEEPGDILSEIKWYSSAFTFFISSKAGDDSFYLFLGLWLRTLECRQMGKTKMHRCDLDLTWPGNLQNLKK